MAHPDEMDSQLLGLPNEERARLARLLLVSLDDQVDNDVEAAWIFEAERRFRDYKNGLVETIDGADVLTEARQAIR